MVDYRDAFKPWIDRGLTEAEITKEILLVKDTQGKLRLDDDWYYKTLQGELEYRVAHKPKPS